MFPFCLEICEEISLGLAVSPFLVGPRYLAAPKVALPRMSDPVLRLLYLRSIVTVPRERPQVAAVDQRQDVSLQVIRRPRWTAPVNGRILLSWERRVGGRGAVLWKLRCQTLKQKVACANLPSHPSFIHLFIHSFLLHLSSQRIHSFPLSHLFGAMLSLVLLSFLPSSFQKSSAFTVEMSFRLST